MNFCIFEMSIAYVLNSMHNYIHCAFDDIVHGIILQIQKKCGLLGLFWAMQFLNYMNKIRYMLNILIIEITITKHCKIIHSIK